MEEQVGDTDTKNSINYDSSQIVQKIELYKKSIYDHCHD